MKIKDKEIDVNELTKDIYNDKSMIKMRGNGIYLSDNQIEVLKRYVDLYDLGDSTWNERRNLLEEQRIKLLEKQKNINATIERLNYKVALYEEIESGKRKDFT